jgi:hypothetical protein
MDQFLTTKFSGDIFSVSEDRIKASDLLGFGYTIPERHWQAELALPRHYEVGKLKLKELWKSERWVPWPEVDMQLNMENDIIPLGWRVFNHLYYQQDDIPMEWLTHLMDGNIVMFPYAVCYWRDKDGNDIICCPTFYYDAKHGIIDCEGVNRGATGSASPIAVYHQS